MSITQNKNGKLIFCHVLNSNKMNDDVKFW